MYPEDFRLDSSVVGLKIVNILRNDNGLYSPIELKEKLKFIQNILNAFSLLDAMPRNWKVKLANKETNYIPISGFSLDLDRISVPIHKLTNKKIFYS